MSEKAKGGITVGPSHDKGGIPLVVKSTGQHIEMEGDEYVFKSGSLDDKEQITLEGSPWEIIQQIAKKNGSSLAPLKEVDGGEFVICKKVLYDKEKIKISGTAQSIVNELQSDKGCKTSAGERAMGKGGSIEEFDVLNYLFGV